MHVSKEHTVFNFSPRGRATFAALLIAVASGAASPAFAQATAGMEERLRAQLRITTTQLQQAQNELALLKSANPGQPAAGAVATTAAPATADIEALKKELAQSRGQLAAERQSREKQGESAQQTQQQAQAVVDKANAQVSQFRGAYDELLKLARASEAERQRLASEATLHKATLVQCEAKNVQLYAAGQEILRAYETLDLGDVVAARQPFAAQSRVKFEAIAQQYGDTLYAGRFDARSVTVPEAATSVVTPPTAKTP